MAALIADLMNNFARPGRVEWIGVRPTRHGDLKSLDKVAVELGGLAGDHRNKPGARAVTLIQAEHLPVIGSLAGRDVVRPEALRRNIMVSGINLLALRRKTFRLGSAVLRGTGLCVPCSRMEEAVGPGGYNAMRGHGGLTAEVLEPGDFALGDAVVPVEDI